MILDDQIVDDGISAFTGDNLQAGLGRFLEGVEAGRIPRDTVLLIENMDRFSRRNPVDALPKFLEVLALGLTVVTLQDELIHTHDAYSGDPTAIMRSLLSMQLAYEESKKKSVRARETWDNRLLRISGGQRLSMSKVPFWIDRGTAQLNHRADDAKRVFELALAGNGASNITRMLNSEGIPSPRGGSWGKSVVQDVLKSKAAFGTLVVREHEQPDYFPPIVSKDNWLALQNRAAQQRRNPQASTDANLFSRLLKCGGCGGPICVSTAYGRYRYARCDNQVHRRNDCKMGSWPYNKLEELIVSRMGALLSLPPDPLQESPEDAALVEEIQSLKARLDRTIALSIEAETTETSSLYRSAADGLARQIEAAKGRLARLEENGASRVVAGEMIEDMQQAWEEVQALRTSDRPRLRAMIAAVVDEVRLMPFDTDDFNVAQVKLKTMREPHNVFLEPDSIRGRKAGVPKRPNRRKRVV
ncbi:DNA invertase Pin-like site-specific DNA recombinase [Rhizobium aquaticum]|uniref:DNA invertase Pin-like site-specific DNA recombinase n=1 Tax=Rhizobium aquaticum TaxID=1549636 RepID=A0ABV2IWC0_9HYPH